jgi:hypothetical protein
VSPSDQVHLGALLDIGALDDLAAMLCGEPGPKYRTGSALSDFFTGLSINARHDGSSRWRWARNALMSLSPEELERVVLRLGDLREYSGDEDQWGRAVHQLRDLIALHGFGLEFNGMNPYLTRVAIQTPIVPPRATAPIDDESAFLAKRFADAIDVASIGIEPTVVPFIEQRIAEARACDPQATPLGIIFLLGSALEGILLGVARLHMAKFMSSPTAPKRNGSPKPIHEWKLVELIDVAAAVDLVGLDVKKFSHALRDFRNYIHPFEQMSQNYSPDEHTVAMCWQVLKAAVAQMKTT